MDLTKPPSQNQTTTKQKETQTMIAQLTRKNVLFRYFVPAVILMTFAGIFITRTVFAQATGGAVRLRGPDSALFLNHSNFLSRIDSVATVSENGRRLVLTGPVECTEGEKANIQVTVTQRSTGAVAKGRAIVTCTGNVDQWELRALAVGRESFEEGAATAVAFARTVNRGNTTDAHQWLVDITLMKQ
jgi:hypothetical protein